MGISLRFILVVLALLSCVTCDKMQEQLDAYAVICRIGNSNLVFPAKKVEIDNTNKVYIIRTYRDNVYFVPIEHCLVRKMEGRYEN